MRRCGFENNPHIPGGIEINFLQFVRDTLQRERRITPSPSIFAPSTATNVVGYPRAASCRHEHE